MLPIQGNVSGVGFRDFDIFPDGERFVAVFPEEETTDLPSINVVLNWFQELKERVPVP